MLICQATDAPPDFAVIGSSLVGVMFMGTPHHGARVAIWGDRLLRIVNALASFNARILHELRSDEEGLSLLQVEFERFLQGKGAEVHVFCFYEEDTYFRGQKIVDDASAILASRPHDRMAIHANHVDMTKFTNADDPGYIDVCGELWNEFIDTAPAFVSNAADAPHHFFQWSERRFTCRGGGG
nr:hypothetical protein B0A51_00517 [Rachicladosporium sp. CCFEE 5018]